MIDRPERRELWGNNRFAVSNLLKTYGYIFSHGQYPRGFMGTANIHYKNNVINVSDNLRKFTYCVTNRGSKKIRAQDIGFRNKIIIYYYENKRFEVLYQLFKKFPLLKNKIPFMKMIEPILKSNEVKYNCEGDSYKKIVYRGFELTLRSFIEMYPQIKNGRFK